MGKQIDNCVDQRFSSRLGLLLSALGIAVGTGNIWRFPRIAAQMGGDGGAGGVREEGELSSSRLLPGAKGEDARAGPELASRPAVQGSVSQGVTVMLTEFVKLKSPAGAPHCCPGGSGASR